MIRKSVNKMCRASEPKTALPTLWQQHVSDRSTALISNWATFSKPVLLPNCEEEEHKPLINCKSMTASYAVAIVWRIKGNQLAFGIITDVNWMKKFKDSWGR